MTDETDGTFVVTHADVESAVLRDVDSGQVHTLGDGHEVEAGDVLTATLAPEPPLEVTMEVVEVNPILDSHNETAELAVELIASALGKRIL